MKITKALSRFLDREILHYEEMDATEHASHLIHENMDQDEKNSIIEAVRLIPLSKRKKTIAIALPLMDNNMNGQEKAIILNTLNETPAPQQKDFITHVSSLLTYVKESTKTQTLEFIQALPAMERPDVVAQALFLVWDNLHIEDLEVICNTILNILGPQRDDVITRTSFLMQKIVDKRMGFVLASLIAKIPMQERDDVISRAFSLMPEDADPGAIAFLIRSITAIPPLEREQVILSVSPIMPNDMDPKAKSAILTAIKTIPSSMRQKTIELASPLIHNGMDGEEIDALLRSIFIIIILKQEGVLESTSPLIENTRCGFSIAKILDSVRQVPAPERQEFVKAALLFIRTLPFIKEEFRERLKQRIVELIRLISETDRDQQLKRTLLQLQFDFSNEKFKKRDYANRLEDLLETPLDQPFPPYKPYFPIANPQALAHPLSSRVAEALQLLRQSKEMSPDEIQKASEACIKYLEDHECNRALEVLRGPENPNDGGPFFKPFIIAGVETSGKEIIGRLWQLIDSLPSEQKRENALRFLIDSLNICTNGNNERICNEKKTLYLFLSLLVGNLEGVQID